MLCSVRPVVSAIAFASNIPPIPHLTYTHDHPRDAKGNEKRNKASGEEGERTNTQLDALVGGRHPVAGQQHRRRQIVGRERNDAAKHVAQIRRNQNPMNTRAVRVSARIPPAGVLNMPEAICSVTSKRTDRSPGRSEPAFGQYAGTVLCGTHNIP